MALEIRNVTKKFQDFTAVNDISLTLEKGRMLGFLGRNGAGKTTTFRMILGLTPITSGQITYQGSVIDHHQYDYIGYLPEERGLHVKMTVKDELTYLATLKGMKPTAIRKAIDYWLKRFDIMEHKNKKIDALSKGNQQKVQLLASMLHEPKFLILDEPFSGLDPVNVALLKSAVKDLNAMGTTIIFSSHRMEHIEELCDDVCILNHGELVVSGSLESVKAAYGNKRIVIETTHALDGIDEVEGVTSVTRDKGQVVVQIESESVAEKVFNIVAQQGFVKRFELVSPSIEEIFISKVGDMRA